MLPIARLPLLVYSCAVNTIWKDGRVKEEAPHREVGRPKNGNVILCHMAVTEKSIDVNRDTMM